MDAIRIILLAALVAALGYAAWGDIRTRTIPNPLNAAIALAAPAWWLACGLSVWPDMALQLGVAAIIFLLFAIMFFLGAMGGGDVKLIAALALWLPFDRLPELLQLMAIAGGVLTLAMVVHHRWRRRPGRPEIPYGVAIVLSGLWVVAAALAPVAIA